MIVLVCGSRDYENYEHVKRTLDAIHAERPITWVVNGGQTGADTLAYNWCRQREVPCVTYFAQWTKYGRPAGPIRNARMLDEGKPDLVVAFHGGIGTRNMCRQAYDAGFEVIEIKEPKC